MKISFASLIVFKSLLVDFCTCSADTDTDYQNAFLKNWRATSKKENRKRNLGGIFLDAADAQGGSDGVRPAIIGGTEVDPRRKYKVIRSVSLALLFQTISDIPLCICIWILCLSALVLCLRRRLWWHSCCPQCGKKPSSSVM